MTGGQGQGQGQEDVCADLQDLELKRRSRGHLQHGPGQSWSGAIGSCRDPTSLVDMKAAKRPSGPKG